MALTYGFFNSVRGDRKYNSEQIGRIFDDILMDGIISSYGQHFAVTATGNGMQINVGTGRAWFNHTWSNNDSVILLVVPESDISRSRCDSVVLEVNHEDSTRANSIKILQGVPAASPQPPSLVNTAKIRQYPLAYIIVRAGTNEIKASDIENRVGISPTVFSTGILRSTSLDSLWGQWRGEFEDWFADIKLILSDSALANLTNLVNQKVNISDKATTSEATAGTNNTKWMTPATVKAAIDQIRETVYIQNLGYRVKVNARLSDIKINSYTISYPSSKLSNENYHYIFSNGSKLVLIGSYTERQSSTSAYYDGVLVVYDVSGPFTSNKTWSRRSTWLIGTGNSSYSIWTDIGFYKFLPIGSKATDTVSINFYYKSGHQGYDQGYMFDITTGAYTAVGDIDYGTTFVFNTDDFFGNAYISSSGSGTSRTYRLNLKYALKSSNTLVQTKTTTTSLTAASQYNYEAGSYQNTLYFVDVTNPNSTTAALQVYGLVFNPTSATVALKSGITYASITNAQKVAILYYDDEFCYFLVGDHTVPLKFSFKSETFVNTDAVIASSRVASSLYNPVGILFSYDIDYYGLQDGLHFFRSPTTDLVFTLPDYPSNTTAITLRSNYTINSSVTSRLYRKSYKNEWKTQHFVVPGDSGAIVDLDGHIATISPTTPPFWISPNNITSTSAFSVSSNHPVGPDGEFTLVTDGKRVT